MAEQELDQEIVAHSEEAEAYLAMIAKTIAKAEELTRQVDLRRAETDRMLASQGLTREQVLAYEVPEEYRERVERELGAKAASFAEASAELGRAGEKPVEEGETPGPARGLRMLMRPLRI